MNWDPTQQVPSSAVYTQPMGFGPPVSGPPGSAPVNGVTIRCLQDTPEDAAFAGQLTVDAFRDKFVTNVTEQKLPIAVKHMTATHRGQYESFYRRMFIAEQDGKRLGVLGVKFHGDRERDVDDHVSELGCWHGCRYACFGCMLSEEVDRGKCYLDHICVHEDARGKGVGKLLMERAEYEGRARNCRVIYLAVTTTNRAKNLYERQGYRVTSTESCMGCLGCFIGPPGKVYYMEKPLL